MKVFLKHTGLRPAASISLISILVISAFTLILVVGMSVTSISTYDQSFNTEASNTAYYAAEGCLEEALIRLEGDSSFTGTTLTMDADTDCTISVSGGAPYTLSISVNFLDYTQTFEAEVSLTQSGQIYNSELLRWEEV